jgi:RNA polymerase sigma factor (sigma-70 family)
MEKQRGSGPEDREAGGADSKRLDAQAGSGDAARKRAAIETIARNSGPLKQTARRYSLCKEDAEDAHQRAMEILLTKAPTDQPRELIRWTHTVVKHEALAIRRNRERLLGGVPTTAEGEGGDWVEMIPASGDGPDVRVERRERIARSREALQTLKPAELRALTLLAEGYSYAEISSITGFTPTKVNRSLAEGRERFRKMLAHSEDGGRCTEMGAILSAFCDGEASAEEVAAVREHLRACGSCRAAMRAYRATPGTVAALAPALPISRSLLDRAHEAFAGLTSRLPGGGGGTADSTVAQVAAAGGTRGAGMAALAKLLAICAGTAGGAAACVATGIAPSPVDLTPNHEKAPAIERSADFATGASDSENPVYEPAPPAADPKPEPRREPPPPVEQAPDAVVPSPTPEAGGIEYTAPEPAPSSETSSASSESAAGEFGP